VLTSPIAAALAWTLAAGTGLSTTTIRVGPAMLARLPWPAGDLTGATQALAEGDVEACGRAVTDAFAIDRKATESLIVWWRSQLPTPR
jgi:hypothetical protein